MSAEPLRPDALETVIYEPDEQAVVAVVPGALWLRAGDICRARRPASRGSRSVQSTAAANERAARGCWSFSTYLTQRWRAARAPTRCWAPMSNRPRPVGSGPRR